jgi:hypothetical protein
MSNEFGALMAANQRSLLDKPDEVTLRDYFAGQALIGILAGGFADTIPHDDVNGGSDAAAFAYQYADAMIAARGNK